MKPVVRQVDGEWRVWIDTGCIDSQGQPVFRGDSLGDGEEEARIDEGPSAPASWTVNFKVIKSPGVPCEVELPPHLRRDIYACTCGHREDDHVCRDEDTEDFRGPCTKCECASYQEES